MPHPLSNDAEDNKTFYLCHLKYSIVSRRESFIAAWEIHQPEIVFILPSLSSLNFSKGLIKQSLDWEIVSIDSEIEFRRF